MENAEQAETAENSKENRGRNDNDRKHLEKEDGNLGRDRLLPVNHLTNQPVNRFPPIYTRGAADYSE
jgi:hypothetical protein